MKRFLAVVAAGLACALPVRSDCVAQAWLPPAGELTASATVQRVEAKGHFLDDGSRLPGYRTRAINLQFDVSYGLTDRLALDVALPFVSVRYRGPEEPLNLPDNKLDDGSYHGTLADVRVELRGDALNHPVAVAPFIAAAIPTHNYATLGEAASGRGFQEYSGGLYAGALIESLPGAFVHGMYSYAYVRQDVAIPLNHSNAELSAGYLIAQAVQVSLLWRRQWAHGGLTFDELYASSPDVFRNLDRVVRENFQHVGAAVAFPLSESLAAHANFLRFASGVDAHYGWGFSFGVSWTRQLHPEPDPFASRAIAEHRSSAGSTYARARL